MKFSAQSDNTTKKAEENANFQKGQTVTLFTEQGDFCIVDILDVDNDSVVVEIGQNTVLKSGELITLISERGDLWTGIIDVKPQSATIKQLKTERRAYFRIDDYIPIAVKKVDTKFLCRNSKIITGHIYGNNFDMDLNFQSADPALWKMLLHISDKLDFIIERLSLSDESFTKLNYQNVNISASGLRLLLNERFDVGDGAEIRMLLPTCPPTGILAYGSVVRVKELDNQNYEVALTFVNMCDSVRNEIVKYTLNRQREIINKQGSY